jgi:hypothetical protein
MDIAYYVSELLGELGEVNVPGLGNFTQRKIDGYYNEEEAKFYPPAHAVHYTPNFAEDDILAEYIAEQKKISLASSKYFTEKYVNSVKQEAILKDVPLADLGFIRFVVHEFHFKCEGAWASDPAFFGYPQIAVKKLGSSLVIHQAEAIEQAPVQELLPPALQEEPVQEPDIVTPVETIHEAESTELPVAEIPQEFPEEGTELPAIISEPELPAPIVEETAPPVVSEEPVKEEEAIIQFEPVQEPEPAAFDLEAYLRELEASAGIITPESNVNQYEVKAEPVAVKHEPEIPAEESEIKLPEPVAEIEAPVQEATIPEPGPYTPPLPTVELSREPYTPDPELQQYILDAAKPEPDYYTTKPEVADAAHEEEFVFDGKGYDDVDTRRSTKRSLLWLWITLPVILLLGAAAGYVWYMHQQRVAKMIKENTSLVPVKVPVKPDTAKGVADSLKDTTQAAVIKDTTEKAVTAPGGYSTIDSTKVRYELIGVSEKTIAAANRDVVNYKSLGIASAHVLMPGPGMGRLIKVSLGTFMDVAEADAKRKEILKTGNIRRKIDIIIINPKK